MPTDKKISSSALSTLRKHEGSIPYVYDDGDGTSDANDAFLGEPTQWTDSDGDGYGDNPNGTQPDACVATPGTSSLDTYGCVDGDGDGRGVGWYVGAVGRGVGWYVGLGTVGRSVGALDGL